MTEQERLIRRRDRLRLGAILALFLVGSVPVVAAFAADPSSDPSSTASASATATASTPSDAPAARPSATTKPGASAKPDKGEHRGLGGFDFGGKGFGGGRGFGGVTITAISGSRLSLKTDDGWTRTITVTADTKVSKAGVAAKLSDLAVGDIIHLGQKRNTDGTYTITRVDVPPAVVGGEVTARTSTSVTVKTRDGKTVVIHVSSATKIWLLGKKDATIADIAVGDKLIASGVSRADGSLDAKGLGAGDLRGFKGPNGPKTPAAPKPSPTPGA